MTIKPIADTETMLLDEIIEQRRLNGVLVAALASSMAVVVRGGYCRLCGVRGLAPSAGAIHHSANCPVPRAMLALDESRALAENGERASA